MTTDSPRGAIWRSLNEWKDVAKWLVPVLVASTIVILLASIVGNNRVAAAENDGQLRHETVIVNGEPVECIYDRRFHRGGIDCDWGNHGR